MVQRQSRYWTPLLLSWLRGGPAGSATDSAYYDNNNNNNALDLPGLTSKQRRRQRERESSPPEVQIEALRALVALTDWTGGMAVSDDDGGGGGEKRNNNGGLVGNGGSKSSSIYNTLHLDEDRCSPHTPLSSSSQRLLLKHADAVPMMVSLLSSADSLVREQAMWMLGSIASGGLGSASLPSSLPPLPLATSSLATKIDGNGMTTDDKYDNDEDAAAAAAAASAVVDEPEYTNRSSRRGSGRDKSSVSARDVIFAAGGVAPLLKCLADNASDIPLHRVGAWCLSGLVEGRYSSSSSSGGDKDSSSSSTTRSKSSNEEIDVTTLLPTVRRMLHMDDTEVLTYACWTLSHFCDGPAYHIAAVIYSEASIVRPSSRMTPDDGLVPRLVELLLHPSPKVAKPALRTVGNIVCADCTDQQDQYGNTMPAVDFTEIVLECKAIPCLRQLVEHHNREIQKEACWTLSNIAAGTTSQIQAVIDSGAIPPLVGIVNNDLTDKEVRSEACWVVLNATSCGNDEQIKRLIQEGCVSVLGVLLTEANMVMMALEGIERVLQAEEAQDTEDLYHKSEEELGQRPTIIRCAALIKTVTESPHNSSAVAKRAKRIWDQHFISCALCKNNYSRCRIMNSHFCDECKCHVCSRCDCRVYHLSYQEELWAEDEEKAAASKNQKKSKKQKKKQKMKEKKKEAQKEDTTKEISTVICTTPAPSEESASIKEEIGPAKTKYSPSKGTIESDSTSLGATDVDSGDCTPSGVLLHENESEDINYGRQPPIDLVLYLQQTGSIIALAKLLDSLYDNEYEDEVIGGDADREGQQKTIDLNIRVQTTQ